MSTTAPLIIATIARERGVTGVHTHVRQLRSYCAGAGLPTEQVTPHSWADGTLWRRVLLLPLFGVRIILERAYGPANVWWYRSSHEFFLRRALRESLACTGRCTVYAQCPVAAKAALAARSGPHQRVVLAVHFRISQADEWADKRQIPRGGRVYRWIRATERQVLPGVDGIVFVSSWGRSAVREWMPEVDRVPGTVVNNFVTLPVAEGAARRPGSLVSVGSLEAIKNHDYLLRVLSAARRRGHIYSLDVFGEGVERRRLLALAEELGVSDQVRLRGFCSDVQGRLPEYAAYVHASYSESLPLAVIEAMAVGLPVIASPAGGVGELYKDPEHGRFWPIDDVDEGARILIDLMESQDELQRVSRAIKGKFLSDYDAEVVAPRLVRFLQSDEASDDHSRPEA